MPTVRKLSQEEVQAWENRGKGTRKLIEEEYNAILNDYSIGEYGVAELSPEENRLSVRNRLKSAAARRGLALVFRRTKGLQLRFHVELPSEKPKATKPKQQAGSAVLGEKRGRGRPPKSK
jgi:hypothetical protein